MTVLTLAAGVGAVTRYTVPRHPAPVDLDLAGTELPPLAVDASPRWDDSSWRYPDSSPLEGELARRHGVSAERVFVGAGSDDVIERAFRATLDRDAEVVLTEPTFEMFGRYAELIGARVVSVPWPDGPPPLDAMLAAITPSTRLLALASPNNPTGTTASHEQLLALARGAPNCVLLVDGAYAEFNDDTFTALAGEPNVLLTRTFSKAWGMAGWRVGYGIGPATLISAMRRVGTPYPVASTSLAMATAAIAGGDARVSQRVRHVVATRERLHATLDALDEPHTASRANFVCTDSARAEWLRDGLAGLGIGVRWLPAGDRPRVRITCPLAPGDVDRLTHGLESVFRPGALLFDLDGVLADVSQSYRTAIIATAAAFGVRITATDIAVRKAAGEANDDWCVTHDLICAGGGDATLGEVTDAFERRYQGSDGTPGLRTAESLIGSRALLASFAARLPLGVVTGRPQRDAERFLAEHDLPHLFAVVIAREAGPLKPDPFPVREALRCLGVTTAWMVGDTPDDIRAARAAGVVPIGMIAPGDNPNDARKVLHAAGAGRVITSIEELLVCLP